MDPDLQLCLNAAQGWLDLGSWSEANEELERIPAKWRAHPEVLRLRCRIYAMAGRWSDVETTAEGASLAYPNMAVFHNEVAWAKHRQGRTAEALSVAEKAAERFPQHGAVAYALACLNGALGRIPEAKSWLHRALDLAQDPARMKLRALDQRELFFLWEDAAAELDPDEE